MLSAASFRPARLRPAPFWTRVLSGALIPLYVNLAVPIVPLGLAHALAAPSLVDDMLAAPAPAPLRTPASVKVNRQLPAGIVSSLPSLQFSSAPTDAELFQAHVLAEPFVPMPGAAVAAENAGLAKVISAFLANPDDLSGFERFAAQFPQSRWTASIRLNLGLRYFHTCYFTQAMASFEQAWRLSASAIEPRARAVADRAVAELIRMNARIGRVNVINSLFNEIADRTFIGADNETISSARAGLWRMENQPGKAFLCGPAALGNIYASLHPTEITPACILAAESTSKGFALSEVARLSQTAGLKLQMVRRMPGAALVAPAVLHWRVGHYSALLGIEDGIAHFTDPTFGEPNTHFIATQSAIDTEASGYMLISEGPLPAGYTLVSNAEGVAVFGKGDPTDADGTQTKDEDCATCPKPRPTPGMPVASAHLMLVSLKLVDTPIYYVPPVGPAVAFQLNYNQREASRPAIPDYANCGSQWLSGYSSFVDESVSGAQCTPTVRPLGGGSVAYAAFNNSTLPATPTQAGTVDATKRLLKVNAQTYERRSADGSKLVYGFRTGAGSTFRYFLTQVVDPAGNALVLGYDASKRLVAITDAIGQVTIVSYALAADPLKMTGVTDPFGRSCLFTYDAQGRLETLTDTLGLTSQVTYQGATTFIASLITPYGTNTYAFGETGLDRWLTLTDPEGGLERIEYRANTASLSNTVPVPLLPVGMLAYQFSQVYRNTFYWDKKASANAGDPASARIYHWLHMPSSAAVSGSLENTKEPLETARTFYNYQGQTSSLNLGTSYNLTKVGRVLDDGTTQLQQYVYNSFGHVTLYTDPVGRETTTIYDTNTIDATEVRQKTGPSGQYEVLAKATYNAQHLPLTVTDAAGQVTTNTYNLKGQLSTTTNAKGETTSFYYDPAGGANLTDLTKTGYLVALDGPLAGTADTTTFSYDGFGRLRTVTDSQGYTVTTDYDVFNRATVVTYPDATYQQIVYDKLDATQVRDRRGLWTKTAYDALRRPKSVRDPLNRFTLMQWCSCGSLTALTDADGRTTRWELDLQSRVTAKIFPDGTSHGLAYETNTSRLKSTTDAKGQTTNYQYFKDDRPSQVSYTGSAIATPTVSYTYDPYYPRVATMTDALGTTAYAFNPIPTSPTLGAGRLATIDGPLAADTIGYTYDQLGRTLTSSINAAANASSVLYDSLGRITSATNPLGTFGYNYVAATGRLDHVDYPNGQRTNYAYYPNSSAPDGNGDQRLQQIVNLRSGGANLSTYGYTYDKEGLIQTWSQQLDAAAALTSSFKYDAADQLTEATVPAVAGVKNYVYRYGKAGNRTSEQIDHAVTAASHNTVNQVTALSPTGPIRIEGTVNEPANITVNGQPAVLDATNKFSADVTLSPGTPTVAVAATDGTGNTATKNYQVTVNNGVARTLAYDLNGNLTADGTGRTYDWDAVNRLVKITQAGNVTEFVYNGQSQRVQEKLNGTLIKQWVWCGGAQPCEERDASNNVTKRFYGQGQLNGSTALFYTNDHLGSVREMTDTSGAVRARYNYDSYGRITKVSGDLEADFGFTGFYRHQATGLNLTLYRAYDADLGRWLSRDPIGESGGVNLYAYVKDNPVNYVDSYGLKIEFGSNSDVGAIIKAWKYVIANNPEAAAAFRQLGQSERVYLLTEGKGLADQFEYVTRTISWDSTAGINTGDCDKYISAALALYHEVAHAREYDTNPGRVIVTSRDPDPQYQYKEEARVITGEERRAANILHEPLRFDHNEHGTTRVSDPTKHSRP